MKTKKKEKVITRLKINPRLQCPNCHNFIETKCSHCNKETKGYWMDDMLSDNVQLGTIIKDIDIDGGVILMASERFAPQLENHIRLIKSMNTELIYEYSTTQTVSRNTGKTIRVKKVEISKKDG